MLLGFLDRAIGRWPAALPFGLLTTGPSRRRSSHRGRAIVGRGNRSLSHCGSSYCGSNHRWLSSSGGQAIQVKLLRVNPLRVNHRKSDVNKRQGCFGRRKNNRLIGKKPPNPVGTEEENQCKKVLVVVQSSRINLPSRPVMRGIITLHLQSTIAALAGVDHTGH